MLKDRSIETKRVDRFHIHSHPQHFYWKKKECLIEELGEYIQKKKNTCKIWNYNSCNSYNKTLQLNVFEEKVKNCPYSFQSLRMEITVASSVELISCVK